MSITTGFPPTAPRSTPSTGRCRGSGIGRSSAAAREGGGERDNGLVFWSDLPCHLPASCILGPWFGSLNGMPEVGARCGKSARRVLSGGRDESLVPTGTAHG